MRTRLKYLSKPELEFLIDNCNFSDEEIIIIRMSNTGSSELQIAEKLNLSTSSICKKKRQVMSKINNFLEVMEKVTTIYVNGKRVTKDELKNHEIQIEIVKKILADKLTKSK